MKNRQQCVRWSIAAVTIIFAVRLDAAVLRDTSKAGITIQAGSYGTIGRKHKLDIAAQLQNLCGSQSQFCQVFCSETSFGRYSLGARPICRVTYRCVDGSVRSVEAAREEPILLRCPEIAVATDALIPPPISQQ